MKITEFKHLCNISLHYKSDCALYGVTVVGQLVAEEYDDDNWVRHEMTLDCGLVQSGEFDLPYMLHTPLSPKTHPLNYSGGRYRGLREDDRVAEWVQPLTIIEKMPLLPYLKLNIPPMLLLGIAESYVTSAAKIDDTVSIVCRRVRLAYALSHPQLDDTGLPYDYDTLALHVAHLYTDDTESSLAEALAGIDGIRLQRPLDCMVYQNKLIIADASDGEHNSRIVVFRINSTSD
jgi:hypothetical protein